MINERHFFFMNSLFLTSKLNRELQDCLIQLMHDAFVAMNQSASSNVGGEVLWNVRQWNGGNTRTLKLKKQIKYHTHGHNVDARFCHFLIL